MKNEPPLQGDGDTGDGQEGFGPAVIAGSIAEVDLLAVVKDKESESGIEIHFEDSDINFSHVGDAEADILLL
jgi:hypothetical protein